MSLDNKEITHTKYFLNLFYFTKTSYEPIQKSMELIDNCFYSIRKVNSLPNRLRKAYILAIVHVVDALLTLVVLDFLCRSIFKLVNPTNSNTFGLNI